MIYALVVALSILSYLLATDIYTPCMPEIARYFNQSSDMVQKTMSYFLFGAVLSCVISGIFADQYGKKRFLLWGMGLAGLGSIMTIFCPSLEWLILGRFLQGLGGAVGPVIGFSVVQELYDEKQQAKIFGLLGVAVSGIPAAAPLLGGVISTYFGWQVIFVIILILFIISAVCIATYLPDSLNKRIHSSGMNIFKSYKEILTSRAFLALALLSGIFNSVEWFYLTFLPFYMQDTIGMSPELYGLIIGILCAWFAVGSFIGSKVIIAFGVHKTIMAGLWLGVLSGLMMWFVCLLMPLSALGISISLSIFLLAFGMLFPSSVSSALNLFKQAKTRASSIRSLFVTGFAFFGSFNAEWVDESTLVSFAGYISICALLAFTVYALRPRSVDGIENKT